MEMGLIERVGVEYPKLAIKITILVDAQAIVLIRHSMEYYGIHWSVFQISW